MPPPMAFCCPVRSLPLRARSSLLMSQPKKRWRRRPWRSSAVRSTAPPKTQASRQEWERLVSPACSCERLFSQDTKTPAFELVGFDSHRHYALVLAMVTDDNLLAACGNGNLADCDAWCFRHASILGASLSRTQ